MKPSSLHFRIDPAVKTKLVQRVVDFKSETGISIPLSEYCRQVAGDWSENPRLHENAETLFGICDVLVHGRNSMDRNELMGAMRHLVRKIKGEKQ